MPVPAAHEVAAPAGWRLRSSPAAPVTSGSLALPGRS